MPRKQSGRLSDRPKKGLPPPPRDESPRTEGGEKLFEGSVQFNSSPRWTLPAARVFNSANIWVENATDTELTFDSQRYDTRNLHSTATNTSRLVARAPGKYTIGASVQFAVSTVGTRNVVILLNSTTLIARDRRDATSSGGDAFTIHTDYDMVIGDYVELRVRQDSGSSLVVQSVGNSTPEFWMHWVSN